MAHSFNFILTDSLKRPKTQYSLIQVDEEVEDLRTDLCDGLKLCLLMEVVLGRRIGRVIKKPLNQHHYLENVNLALRAMTNDGIKLVNIGE